jgi:quinol monooxygenase YgiN
MITLTGQLICANATEAGIVREHLPEHVRLTRAEPGCLSFNVLPTADPLVWQVDESFTDLAAFEAHQTRTKASVWHKATAQVKRDFRISGT